MPTMCVMVLFPHYYAIIYVINCLSRWWYFLRALPRSIASNFFRMKKKKDKKMDEMSEGTVTVSFVTRSLDNRGKLLKNANSVEGCPQIK